MGDDDIGVDTVGIPIRLKSVNHDAILFYLAGRVPISVAEFAEDCTDSEQRIKSILNQRFENEEVRRSIGR